LSGNAVILFVLAPSATATTPQPADVHQAMTEQEILSGASERIEKHR
jgi:hypothetical protein